MLLRLLIHLGLSSPRTQVPAAVTLVITLVFDSNLGKMSDDIFHLRVTSATALTAKVVEPLNLIHQVVHDGDNNLTYISITMPLVIATRSRSHDLL